MGLQCEATAANSSSGQSTLRDVRLTMQDADLTAAGLISVIKDAD